MSEADDLVGCKDALLEAILPNVLFDGWSAAGLSAGAKSLGLADDEVASRFPKGPAEARAWFDDWADRQMLRALDAMDREGMRTHQRVAAGVKARLGVLAPYKDAVRAAISARVSPLGAAQAAQAIYRTVDAIWYWAGDASTDFNFYTKRSLLGAVYTASVLYWLNDTSEGAADTDDFIDRRLADIGRLPSLDTAAREIVRRVTAPFAMIRREVRR